MNVICILMTFIACSDDSTSSIINPSDTTMNPRSTDGSTSDLTINDSNLPRFIVNTGEHTIIDEPKVPAQLLIIEKTDTSYQGRIGIELRGSSSQVLFEKKSYGFETWDSNEQDINVSLLGFPEEEDWILYGPYVDKTLLRNKLIYQLSNEIGQYAVRTKIVELIINDNYLGVYLFMEKLKRDGNRIKIKKLDQDDLSEKKISGGYILKIDKTAGDTDLEGFEGDTQYSEYLGFRSNYDTFGEKLAYPPYRLKNGQETYFLYEYPKAKDIVEEQKLYIQNYISSFEKALIEEDFNGESRTYSNFIDTESFAYFFILNELSGNPDAYRLSTYMYKDRGEKLKMGPIWDFNLAFGLDTRSATNQWIYKYNQYYPGDLWLVHFWWTKLLQDPLFQDKIQVLWVQLRNDQLSTANIYSIIDTSIESLQEKEALNRNFKQWDILGTSLPFNGYVGPDYASEIEYMKRWISNRLDWMDNQINQW